MRSAERVMRAVLLIALGVACSACALRPSSQPQEVAQSTSPAAPTADRGAPSAAAQAAAGGAASTAAPSADDIPAAARLAFERATGALAAGRLDEAEQGFLALTKSNPELGGPFANLGLIYRRAGKPEQAAARLEQAVQTSPQQPVYLNQLGIAYRELGRFTDAQRVYERAIELAPGYAAPHLNLGILLDLYLWDSRGALAAYERYLALAPDGDEKVRKWVAEIRNRKSQPQLVGMRERP